MKTEPAATVGRRARPRLDLAGGRVVPVAVLSLGLVVIWYLGAIYLNSPQLMDRYERQGAE